MKPTDYRAAFIREMQRADELERLLRLALARLARLTAEAKKGRAA